MLKVPGSVLFVGFLVGSFSGPTFYQYFLIVIILHDEYYVLKVSIEAGVTLGWQKYVGDGITIGLDRFGASAPAEVLFDHFGFTVDKIVPQILAHKALAD